MNLQEVAWGHLDWMDLAQDRGILCAVVNVVLLSPTCLDAPMTKHQIADPIPVVSRSSEHKGFAQINVRRRFLQHPQSTTPAVTYS